MLIYDSTSNKYALYSDAELYLNDLKKSIKFSIHGPLEHRQEALEKINELETEILKEFYEKKAISLDSIPKPSIIEKCIDGEGIDSFYEKYFLELVLYIGNHLRATKYPDAKWETHSTKNNITNLFLVSAQGVNISIAKKINKYYFEKKSIPVSKIINELAL